MISPPRYFEQEGSAICPATGDQPNNNDLLRPIGNRYILGSVLWFGVFVLGLPLAMNEFSRSGFYHSTVIAWTHVMTLGILTQLLFGVRTRRWHLTWERPEPSRLWSWVELVGFNGGLIWFLVSMVLLWHRWQLTLAATVLGTTLLVGGLARMYRSLRSKLPGIVKCSDSLAWLSLAIMGFLGFSMAHSKWLGFMGPGLTLHWIKTHFVMGASGWFGPLLLAITIPRIPDPGRSRSYRAGFLVLIGLLAGLTLALSGIWSGVIGLIRAALIVWCGALLSWGYLLFGRPDAFPSDPDSGGDAWLGFGMIYLILGLLLPLFGTGLRSSIAGTILILIGLFHAGVGIFPSGTEPATTSPSAPGSRTQGSPPATNRMIPGAWCLGLAHLGLVLMVLSQWAASLVLTGGAWLLFSGSIFTSLRHRWSAMHGEPTEY